MSATPHASALLFAELRAEGLLTTFEIAQTGIDIAAVNSAADDLDIERHMTETAHLLRYLGVTARACNLHLRAFAALVPGAAADVAGIVREAYGPLTAVAHRAHHDVSVTPKTPTPARG